MHVHISNLAAQTGASLFLQTHTPPYPTFLPSLHPAVTDATWTYSKTENLTLSSLTADRRMTHLIAESPEAKAAKGWKVARVVDGFKGWKLDKDLIRDLKSGRALDGGVERLLERLAGVLRMEEAEALWILERVK